ncbi:MAG: NINE protein [Pseudomonadota bacterium]
MPSNSISPAPHRSKNKTAAAWLAFILGQLGLHRFYLFGIRDRWAWLHPAIAAIGWWGVYRVQLYGQDDHIAWLLIPLLGFTLAGTSITAIYYGLMPTEKWNAIYNPALPDTASGDTSWLTIGAVVFALLFGAITLMSSIAFSFQRYFEYQVEEARKISQ